MYIYGDIGKLTNPISDKLNTVFNDSILRAVAIECRFLQRCGGKLKLVIFFDVIMESVAVHGYESLRGSATELLEQRGISGTKQSLCGQFNEQASLYIQHLFERVFTSQSSMKSNKVFQQGGS